MNFIQRLAARVALGKSYVPEGYEKGGGWRTIYEGSVRHSEAEAYSDAAAPTAYSAEALVFACVRLLGNSFSEPPIWVYKLDGKGEKVELPNHPIYEILETPNPSYTNDMLERMMIQSLALTGKSFVWKFRNGGRQLAELWPVPSSLVEVIPGTDTLIERFEIRKTKHTDAIIVQPEDMIYTWLPSPHSTYDGIGCLQAAWSDYQVSSEQRAYLSEMLANVPVPGAVVTTPDGSSLTPKQTDDLREALNSRAGNGSRGRAIKAEGGVKIEPYLPLADLDWPGLTSLTEARICSAFGVPPIMVGARVGLDRGTYSNYGQARKSFYADTLSPLWRSMGQALTKGLLEGEGVDGVYIDYNLDGVMELQEDEKERANRAAILYNAGIISREHAQYIAGVEVHTDGEFKASGGGGFGM